LLNNLKSKRFIRNKVLIIIMKKRVGLIILFLISNLLNLLIVQGLVEDSLTDSETDLNLEPETDLRQIKENSYIIELKELPLIEQKASLQEKARDLEESEDFYASSAPAIDPKIKLKKEHQNALNDISDLIGEPELATQKPGFVNFLKSIWDLITKPFKFILSKRGITGFAVSEPNSKLKYEYYNVFNGFSLEITEEQAEKIKDESDATSECQDGIDNDEDGLTDHLEDIGCSSPQDYTEIEECQDGLDNDADWLIDLEDPGCLNEQDNDESDATSECQDGIDNDEDGLRDLEDPGCLNEQDNDESGEVYTEICTAEDLDNIRNNLNRNYKQVCDIDLTGWDWEPIGIEDRLKGFRGVFNGNGYEITNYKASDRTAGLFYLSTGIIHNVKLIDIDFSNVTGSPLVVKAGSITFNTSRIYNGFVSGTIKEYGWHNLFFLGGLASQNYGVINNCSSDVEFIMYDLSGSSPTTGGLVGKNTGTINNSYSSSSFFLTGGLQYYCAGGLVGLNGDDLNSVIDNSHAIGNVIQGGGLVCDNVGIIRNSYATGNVGIDTTYENGGLVGNNRGIVESCIATGNVNGSNTIGGLIGRNLGHVINSSSSGTISSKGDEVGGLIGWIWAGPSYILDSYSTSNVYGKNKVGGLIGHLQSNTNINNSYFTGAVNGISSVGGLVGHAENERGKITHSYAKANVSGNINVGGLLGLGEDVVIQSSYSLSNVTGKTAVGGLAGHIIGNHNIANVYHSNAYGLIKGNVAIGGLVGMMQGKNVSVIKSFANTNISGDYSVGGLVGVTWPKYPANVFVDFNIIKEIKNSYSEGNINGRDYVGGLIGDSDSSTQQKTIVENSYSNVHIGGDNFIGGLIGVSRPNDEIINSYWDIDTSGLPSSSGGVGKSTNEMKQEATYQNWDFDYIWEINENNDYPRLREKESCSNECFQIGYTKCSQNNVDTCGNYDSDDCLEYAQTEVCTGGVHMFRRKVC